MRAVLQSDYVSIADYLAGEEVSSVKHEYIGGTVRAMAGASNGHNEIALNALAASHQGLRGKKCKPYNSDTKVRIETRGHTRFYYPDAMVVYESNPRTDHYQDQPVAIMEVMSESTRRVDLGEKCDAYKDIPSLQLLLLVEADRLFVTVHRRCEDLSFSVEVYTEPNDVIDMPEVGISLCLSDLYLSSSLV